MTKLLGLDVCEHVVFNIIVIVCIDGHGISKGPKLSCLEIQERVEIN